MDEVLAIAGPFIDGYVCGGANGTKTLVGVSSSGGLAAALRPGEG